MERDSGSPRPELFPSLPGAVFPLYHVLADLGELAGAEVVEAISSDPLRVTALALRTEDRTVMLAANLGPEPVTVRLSLPWESASLRRLDATNAVDAMTAPEAYRARTAEVLEPLDGTFALELLPYAVMRLEGSPARMPALRDRP
jgi:hypothetical protein